jgi:hypothetical protein
MECKLEDVSRIEFQQNRQKSFGIYEKILL